MIKMIARFFVYILIFLKEMIMANIQVAKLVLSPKLNFTSAAVKFKSAMTSKTELILITNSITLTPGTLVMDSTLDNGEILIHTMSADSAAHVKETIKKFPEEKVLWVTRGS